MINIVIPVYNVERYIRRCLDSVKNQTWPEFKAILVDDGSTDNCGLICDEYAKADERFIVFHKQNGGLTSAVKYGIKNSPKCDYFMFVDSDDFLEVTAVEKVSKAIEQSSADIINYDFFVDFEEALTSRATEYGTSGIKKTGMNNNALDYKMELKIKGYPDRLFSSKNDYVFDIYSERGLH